MRWLFGLFLVAHGLVHGAIATAGGLLAGSTFVVSGITYVLDASWWPLALGAASGLSLVLLLATFTTWWLLALAIDVALGVVALRSVGGS